MQAQAHVAAVAEARNPGACYTDHEGLGIGFKKGPQTLNPKEEKMEHDTGSLKEKINKS